MQHYNNVHFYGQLTAAAAINALSSCGASRKFPPEGVKKLDDIWSSVMSEKMGK